jgi:polyhydroxyalkanoate synthesis regulator phasin
MKVSHQTRFRSIVWRKIPFALRRLDTAHKSSYVAPNSGQNRYASEPTMSLRENPLLKKMIATGEERMSKLAANLLTNEKLMGVVQKTFSAALDAKGLVEKNLQAALSTLNVPTANDVKKLEGKLEELEKVFESLSSRIASLSKPETAHHESNNIPRA